MLNLSELRIELRNRYESPYPIYHVYEYSESVLVLDIKTELLYIGIDLEITGDIKIIFRNAESKNYFNYVFESNFNNGYIYKNGEFLSPFKDIGLNNSSIIYILDKIVNKILSIEKDTSLLAKINISKKIEMIESNDKLNYNSVYSDMAYYLKDKQLTLLETLNVIEREKISIARYGDGEFLLMVTDINTISQSQDKRLMQELRDISQTKVDNLLICYPSLLIECPFWSRFWPKHWHKCKFYLNQDRLGDSMISRPEIFTGYGKDVINLWKRIWDNKRVCFVTGKNSKMNGNHPIYSNIKEASYIYGKNKESYSEIDKIEKECLQSDAELFLIALGPTATCLAARLAKKGKWALDIGHLNNSYDNVFFGGLNPELIEVN